MPCSLLEQWRSCLSCIPESSFFLLLILVMGREQFRTQEVGSWLLTKETYIKTVQLQPSPDCVGTSKERFLSVSLIYLLPLSISSFSSSSLLLFLSASLTFGVIQLYIINAFLFHASICSFTHVQGNQEPTIMAGKPKLHYFNARGRMESIRWLLAAAGVEVGPG